MFSKKSELRYYESAPPTECHVVRLHLSVPAPALDWDTWRHSGRVHACHIPHTAVTCHSKSNFPSRPKCVLLSRQFTFVAWCWPTCADSGHWEL